MTPPRDSDRRPQDPSARAARPADPSAHAARPADPAPRDAQPGDAPQNDTDGVKVYGVAACRALWRARPEDVIRAYVLEAQVPQFTDLLKAFAQRRRPYHVVADDDLRRLTDTVHHGGVCLLAKPKRPQTLDSLLHALQSQPTASLVYLDGVENPHNVGAILRTCAHFGARAVLVDARLMSSVPPSAARVAVGGAEAVSLVPVEDPVAALQRLSEVGFKVLTADMREGEDLFRAKLPKRALFLLGAETTGVSEALRAAAAGALSISGTGKVESLNVSCAASVLLAEFWRQHLPRPKPAPSAQPARPFKPRPQPSRRPPKP
jgi:TrmH RNA methyltransferase